MKLRFFGALSLLAVLSACGDAPPPTATPASGGPLLNTTTRVTVSCPPVLYIGFSDNCSAQGWDVNNNPTTTSATFSSSNPSSVSVYGSTVTANAPGEAWIYAQIGTASGSAKVKAAYVAQLTSVSVSPNPTSVVQGYTRQLTATGYDQYGIAMSGLTFSWSSSNTSLATVSSSGLVTGVGVGSVSITASSGGKSGSASVSVTTPPLAVGISGNQYVTRYQSAQYTASTSGGTPGYTYEWRSRQGNAYSWGAWQNWSSTGSTNYTYASVSSCGIDRNQLEVRVTDSLGAQATSSYTVYISNPC